MVTFAGNLGLVGVDSSMRSRSATVVFNPRIWNVDSTRRVNEKIHQPGNAGIHHCRLSRDSLNRIGLARERHFDESQRKAGGLSLDQTARQRSYQLGV
jgi:hypothetical protein